MVRKYEGVLAPVFAILYPGNQFDASVKSAPDIFCKEEVTKR